jgi:hypothetical protein
LPEIENTISDMPDSPNQPFSKRQGYRSQPKEIAVREGAPENLRQFVLDAARDLGLEPSDLRTLVCSVLHKRPNPGNWSEYPNVWEEVQNLIYGCEWFNVYDLIEKIYRRLGAGTGEAASEGPSQFQTALNEFFVDEGIGWQMVDGQIITRGSQAFEAGLQTAVEVLGETGRLTAQDEIREALRDLSRRPEPDLTGAIQHAMGALECVARDVCGDEHATLGEIIKGYPGVIPKPLDESIAKAWGYASEKARHIREGQRPNRKEVELIVGLAATVATYLRRR